MDKPDDQSSESGASIRADRKKSSYLAVELAGREHNVWKSYKQRFFFRILSKVKGFFRKKIPGHHSIEEESAEAIDKAIYAAKAILKRPHLHNAKIAAEIAKSLAEAKLLEAQAVKVSAEARVVNAQASQLETTNCSSTREPSETREILHSQQVITNLLTQGELYAEAREGVLYIVYKPVDTENGRVLSEEE
jgi:hypothetical protein